MDKERRSFLYLTWEDLDDQPQEVQVRLDSTKAITIGRGSSNTINRERTHIAIASSNVSAKHAKLESIDGQLTITDLDSTNGTFVNKKRIPPETARLLQDGDRFSIRPIEFTVIIKSALVVQWSKQDVNEGKIALLPISFGRGAKEGFTPIILPDDQVSRHHADIDLHGEQLVLIDHSANGTYLNGLKHHKKQVPIQEGDKIEIGPYTIEVYFSSVAPEGGLSSIGQEESQDNRLGATTIVGKGGTTVIGSDGTTFTSEDGSTRVRTPRQKILSFDPISDSLQPVPVLTSMAIEDLPDIFKNGSVVRFSELQSAGMSLEQTTYLAIGGGLGSFAWVDHLVICGADPKNIVAFGFPPQEPYGRYQKLCRNSQIQPEERLRSNSDSCPDNIWGWPGYAVREMWDLLKQYQFASATKIAWQIFNEPLAETYTPRSDKVFESIDREAERIGWDQIWREGRVEAIRKTDDERYVILYSQPQENNQRLRKLMVADYVHLSVGYPGVRFLKDLVEYREKHEKSDDKKRIVQAYEEHEHVYDHLLEYGGMVLIRGSGIVASRVIQRVHEVRRQRIGQGKEPNIVILSLVRENKEKGNTFNWARRVVEEGWEFQPFNWPKATWSGPMRDQLEQATPQKRAELLAKDSWGGTTTASRKEWRDIIKRGRKEGWYKRSVGKLTKVTPTSDKKVKAIIRTYTFGEETPEVDFIIDATGLMPDLDSNPLLCDLMEKYNLERNREKRLQVSNEFEIEKMKNKKGRMYAAGVMTLGGPYAPVDTFLGLQYAALCSVDALSKQGAPGLKKLNVFGSFWQWLKWVRGVKP